MHRQKTELLEWKTIEEAAEILKSVAHPLRLRIVDLLKSGEMTVTHLQTALGTSQSMTSQQLSLMKTRGVLDSRKEGKLVYYFIRRPEVIQVLDCLKKCQS